MSAPRSARRLFGAGLSALLGGALLLTAPAPPAGAVSTHHMGYQATVLGFTSWYGSYGMGSLGTAWCIDHGIRSPDPAYGYVATELPGTAADTQAAMAWVVGAHGQSANPARHAAVMLVLHDLMGAQYPQGRIDVDRLTSANLAGFNGREAEVIAAAREIKADGVEHARLIGPLRLSVEIGPLTGGKGTVTVALRDARGNGVGAVPVQLEARGGGLAAANGSTGADGRWSTTIRPATLPATVTASATVPDMDLDAWAPTTRPAQRVARPVLVRLSAAATIAAPPPTTTTTVPPTSTTTIPPTTTTTVPPTTTTTIPPTTTTIAVATPPTLPPSTTSTTSPPSTTTSTTAVPFTPTAAAPPTQTPSLPHTGVDTIALVLVAVGLLLLGAAAVSTANDRGRAWLVAG